MRSALVVILLLAGCKIDCSTLPDNRPVEVVVIPIRVVEQTECKDKDEYIKSLEYRLNFENCTSTYSEHW